LIHTIRRIPNCTIKNGPNTKVVSGQVWTDYYIDGLVSSRWIPSSSQGEATHDNGPTSHVDHNDSTARSMVIPIITAFSETELSTTQLTSVMQKTLDIIKDMSFEELPVITYNLLLLTKKVNYHSFIYYIHLNRPLFSDVGSKETDPGGSLQVLQRNGFNGLLQTLATKPKDF
jgi:hypothetical protein